MADVIFLTDFPPGWTTGDIISDGHPRYAELVASGAPLFSWTGSAAEVAARNGYFAQRRVLGQRADLTPYLVSQNQVGATPALPQEAILRREEAQGTNGGDATTGAWNPIAINTVTLDLNSTVDTAPAAGVFRLAAGTYVVQGGGPFGVTNRSQLRLYNLTTPTVLALSSSAWAARTTVLVHDTFTVAASQDLVLQYRVDFQELQYGLGTAANFGTEVYHQLHFRKID